MNLARKLVKALINYMQMIRRNLRLNVSIGKIVDVQILNIFIFEFTALFSKFLL